MPWAASTAAMKPKANLISPSPSLPLTHSSSMTPDQKEELRRLVLGFMAKRSACAFNCVSVQAGIRRDMPCTEAEAEECLLFLKSAGYLDEIENKLGSRRYYQANSAGVLAYERGD